MSESESVFSKSVIRFHLFFSPPKIKQPKPWNSGIPSVKKMNRFEDVFPMAKISGISMVGPVFSGSSERRLEDAICEVVGMRVTVYSTKKMALLNAPKSL